VSRGTVSDAHRRTRHARRRRARSAYTKERILELPGPRARNGFRGHCHRSCDGMAVSTQLTNWADCQHDTGGHKADRGLLDTVEGHVQFCRGVIGHIGPTKTSELNNDKRSAPGSCRYQPIALPSDHVGLALKSISMLGLSLTTGKGPSPESRRIIPATPP
jgi:hypothetical protein